MSVFTHRSLGLLNKWASRTQLMFKLGSNSSKFIRIRFEIERILNKHARVQLEYLLCSCSTWAQIHLNYLILNVRARCSNLNIYAWNLFEYFLCFLSSTRAQIQLSCLILTTLKPSSPRSIYIFLIFVSNKKNNAISVDWPHDF